MGLPKRAPSGSYADKLWRDALRRAVLKRVDKEQKLDIIAGEVVAQAMRGDMSAAKEIGDRLDGRAHQTQDTNITHHRMVEAPMPAKDADTWASEHRPVH